MPDASAAVSPCHLGAVDVTVIVPVVVAVHGNGNATVIVIASP